jgi:hypothetical protein
MYCSLKAGIISAMTDGEAAPPMAVSARPLQGRTAGVHVIGFLLGKAYPPGRTDWTCIPEISLCTPHGNPAGSFPGPARLDLQRADHGGQSPSMAGNCSNVPGPK